MKPTPTRIGRYEIVDRIGQGGMGSLYLARDPLLDRPLAIKVLSSDDDELRERFAREARSAAALKHPNIVTLYDVGTFEDRPFIAMEYIDGETLAEAIRRNAPLNLSRKLQLMIELCAGLGYAHRRGIIHRDIKPANLMINAEGVLKILDFGIARIATGDPTTGLTRTGMMMGTVHYMSPEQIEGAAVDQRSDIFAVGLVCYELLSGRKAYGGGATHEILYKIMHRGPQPLAELSPNLDPELYAGIEKAIQKAPDDRYQVLEVFGEDLRRIRSRLDIGNDAPTFIEPRGPRAEPDTGKSGLTPSGSSAAGAGTPASVPRLQDIARRRQTQIDGHLKQAQQHYDAYAFEAAIEQCEQAALLDPQDARVLDLLQRSHQALTDQRERERIAEQARAVEAAVARARTHFASGAFEAAGRAAAEALAIDPAHHEAVDLKSRSENAIEARRRQEEERQRREEERERQQAELRRRQQEDEAWRRQQEEELRRQRKEEEKDLRQREPAGPGRNRAALVAAAVALIAIASYGGWWLLNQPQPGPDPGANVQAVLDDASRVFQSGDRQRAVTLAASLRSNPAAVERADRLLTTFRQTAAGEAGAARSQAIKAGVAERDLAAADKQRDLAASDGDTGRAITLYEDAKTGYARAATQIPGPNLLADARGRAIIARTAAVAARAESDPSFATAAKRMAAADNLKRPADISQAVALYDEADRLFRAAAAAVVPIGELLKQAEAARRNRQPTRVIDLVQQIQLRDRTNTAARDLLASVIGDADTAATTARLSAVSANATSAAPFQRGDAKLAEARRLIDPRLKIEAFGEAATLFREAEKTPPPPPQPPPGPPPADPTARARTLLGDAETALKAGAVDQAEKLLKEIDSELKSGGGTLSAADEARRAAIANGIRSRRADATRKADLAGIQTALNEYRDAYSLRDLDRLLAVAPFLRSSRAQLEASFKQMSNQTLDLTTSEPDIDGARATVTFREVLTQASRVAGKLPPTRREGHFVLTKNAATNAWVIEAMKPK